MQTRSRGRHVDLSDRPVLANGAVATAAVADATCSACTSGRLLEDRVKSVLWDGDRLVVVEDIPALLCSACGEQFFEDRTALALDLMRGGGFPPGEAERQMTVQVFRYRSPEPDREGA